jgi:hypothetical protein
MQQYRDRRAYSDQPMCVANLQGVTKYVKGGEKGLMEALLTKGPMTGENVLQVAHAAQQLRCLCCATVPTAAHNHKRSCC